MEVGISQRMEVLILIALCNSNNYEKWIEDNTDIELNKKNVLKSEM